METLDTEALGRGGRVHDIVIELPAGLRAPSPSQPKIRTARWSQSVFCGLMSSGEASICAAIAMGMLLRIGLGPLDRLSTVSLGGALTGGSALFALSLLGAAGFDRFGNRGAIVCAATCTALPAGIIAALSGTAIPAIMTVVLVMFSAAILARLASLGVMSRALARGHLVRSVAVIGGAAIERDTASQALRRRNDVAIAFEGSIEDADALRGLCAKGLLDEIVIVDNVTDTALVKRLAELPVLIVRMVSRDRMLHIGRAAEFRWGLPVTVIASAPQRDWGMLIKRAIDIAGASVLLVLLSPIMLIAALLVILDSGTPVFFRQQRFGYGGRLFDILKFRTMHAMQNDSTGSVLTSRNDPRVTRVGAVLRRTSIDELPQLFNVLRGEMSLVGPRPHPSGAKAGGVLYGDLIPNFYARYVVLPGITGLAQVNGLRGNTETQKHLIDRFRKDMEYAHNWSPGLDVVLLIRTIWHIFHSENAY